MPTSQEKGLKEPGKPGAIVRVDKYLQKLDVRSNDPGIPLCAFRHGLGSTTILAANEVMPLLLQLRFAIGNGGIFSTSRTKKVQRVLREFILLCTHMERARTTEPEVEVGKIYRNSTVFSF